MENRGLILDKIQPEDYVFGGKTHLGGDPIQKDGQWDEFVPEAEVQNIATETQACVSFGTLNAVEILANRLYGRKRNYSDRYLAKVSDTTQYGNTPQKVAETLRKKGCPLEDYWPYTPDLDTWEKYYAEIPVNVKVLASEFFEWDFGHEYVPPSPLSMMAALEHSPLGVAVYAWERDPNTGYYIRPNGARSTHWCVIYGYERNKYWKCFDSYDNTHKKLAWDFGFEQVKRYTLHKQVVNQSAWERFLELIRKIFDPGSLGGKRSPKWRTVRNEYARTHHFCEICGRDKIQVHHRKPFHLFPELELEPTNLISLCADHHLTFGHLGSYHSYNENIEEDARIWQDKYRNRP